MATGMENSNMKDAAAIVLAAGQGKRMHSKVAKQFLELKGRPLIYYSLKAFEDAGLGNIILVTGEENISYCRENIVEKYGLHSVSNVVAGGAERYHSVYNGLQALKEYSPRIVMIHDGARPFVTGSIIEASYRKALETGAAVVGVPVKDTIKVVNTERIAVDTPDRSTLWQVQTPQTFLFKELVKAYELMMNASDTSITDDAMVMERYGSYSISMIDGDYKNIKITTPEDMIIANAYIS